MTEMKDFKAEQTPTDINCDKCGKPMIIKWGRNGQFLACSGYPDCKNTKPFVRTENGGVEAAPDETTSELCPKCGSGMVVKRGGSASSSPVRATRSAITPRECPPAFSVPRTGNDRGASVRFGKMFYSCANYPNCKFAVWYKPVPRPCPQCGAPFLTEKYSKKTGPYIACYKKECGYKEGATPDVDTPEPPKEPSA